MLEVKGVTSPTGRRRSCSGCRSTCPTGRCCLMGRNGVGKTTLLNAVVGLLPARSGRIRLDGGDLTRAIAVPAGPRRDRLRAAGPPGVPGLTVRENLQSCTSGQRGGDPAAIDDAVDLFPALASCWVGPPGCSRAASSSSWRSAGRW